MTNNDLANLRKEAQKLIKAYIDADKMRSISGLAKEAKIHPAQLLLFMRGERGLTDTSLSRIGQVINNKKAAK